MFIALFTVNRLIVTYTVKLSVPLLHTLYKYVSLAITIYINMVATPPKGVLCLLYFNVSMPKTTHLTGLPYDTCW